ANANIDDFTEDFQNLITRYAWGTIWTRPGLDRRMRSAVTLTAMVAGKYWDELAMHVKAARRNGLSVAEIKEILLQTAIYCWVPGANVAFPVAKQALAEYESEEASIAHKTPVRRSGCTGFLSYSNGSRDHLHWKYHIVNVRSYSEQLPTTGSEGI